MAVTRHCATPKKLPAKHLPRVPADELEAETRRLIAKMSQLSRALQRFVDVCAGVVVDEVAFEDVIDQDGELAGGGRHRLRLADARREPSEEGPERGRRAAETRRRQTKRDRRAIDRRAASGNSVSARPRSCCAAPGSARGGEVPRAGPAGHVRPDFRDELERGVGPNPVELRQVDSTGDLKEHVAHIERRVDALAVRPRRL